MQKTHALSEIAVWLHMYLINANYRNDLDKNKIVLQAERINDTQCIVEVIDPKLLHVTCRHCGNFWGSGNIANIPERCTAHDCAVLPTKTACELFKPKENNHGN